MDVLLRVNNLKTYFYTSKGVVKAVDGVSFEIKAGETLGIVGESGSGKSMTALSILRLVPLPGKIVEGEIFLDGTNLLKLPEREMRRIRGSKIAIIFQDPMTALNPVLTIGRQIYETIIYHDKTDKRTAIERAIELLRSVEIPRPSTRIKEYPHQFSGGMRQRVMIAIALSHNPKVLIADEPTTGLDVTIQAQILELIEKTQEKSNSSAIIITHDMGVIAERVDNVLVMYAGKPIEYGDVETIFYESKHPYTKGLLKSIPKLNQKKDERLVPIDGLLPSLLNLPEGCPFSPRCSYAKEICYAKSPVPVNLNEKHVVSCHLVKS